MRIELIRSHGESSYRSKINLTATATFNFPDNRKEIRISDMLRKLLSKSGRRLLRAIKKLSTRSRKVKKSQNLTSWQSAMPELETESLSWSLPSLDTKSIDTFTTYVADNSEDGGSMCCFCDEYEENQRNENIENEMMI